MKKFAGDIIILHMCTKNHNIWCTVPEIWSETDIIFGHSGPFFVLLPTMDLENQNFEKMKKKHGNIFILQMCTINESHMMYGSWDMEYNRQNFFVILDHFFALLTPLTICKIKILKKWKNHQEILPFCTGVT